MRRLLGRICLGLALAFVAAATALALWARDDARLTALVQRQLDAALPNQAAVGRIHWRPPLGVEVHDLWLKNHPNEPPALQIHALSSKVALAALLRGHIALGPTDIDALEIWLDADSAPQASAQAVEGGQAGPSSRTLSVNLARALTRLPVLELRQVRLRHSRVAGHSGAWGGSIDALSVDVAAATDGRRGAHTRLNVLVEGLAVHSPDGLWQLSQGALTVQDLSLEVVPAGAAEAVRLDLGKVALRAPGVDVEAAASALLHADDSFDGALTVDVGATLDHPALQRFVAPPARRALAATGGLQAQLVASAHGSLVASPAIDRLQGEVRVGGHNVGVMHIPVTGLTAQFAFDSVAGASAQLYGAWDEASSVALAASARLEPHGLGAHHVRLVAQDVAVARLLGRLQPLAQVVPAWRPALTALAQQRALWPQGATVRLAGDGATLWPRPRSRWAVSAQAGGLADKRIPTEAQPITVTAQVAADDAGIKLQQFDVALGHSRIVLNAAGSCGWSPNEPAQLRVTADSLKLAALLTGAGSPLSAQRLQLTLGISGTPNAPKGQGFLRLLAVNLTGKGAQPAHGPTPGGVTLGNITVPMNFTGGTLMARGATLAGQVLQVSLSGFVQLLGVDNAKLKQHAMGLELRLQSPDLDALLQRPQDPAGPSRLRGQLLVGGTVEQPQIMADVGAQGPLGHASAWASADGAGAALRKLAIVPTGGGMVWADGSWQRHNDRLAVNVGGQLPNPSHHGQATLKGSLAGTLSELLNLQLDVHADDSHLLASGKLWPQAERLDINVAARGALPQLAQWQPALLAERPTGQVNLQAHVAGALASPRAQGTVVASGLGLGGRPMGGGRLQALLQTPEAGHYHLEVRAPKALEADVNLYTGGAQAMRIEADIPHFALAALYPPLGVQGADVVGDGVVKVRLGRRTYAPLGTLTLRHLVATSRGQQMALEEPAQVRLDGANVGLDRMMLSGGPGRLVLEGHVGPVVRASLAGRLALSFLTPFVPALTYARGEMTVDARAYGARARPQLEGQVQVTQPVVVRPRGLPLEVRLATGRITLTPQRLAISDLRGGIEGGSFAVGGHVALADYRPTTYALHVDGHGIPVRQGDLMLESNFALACEGPGNGPVVRGTVDIVSGRYLRALQLQDFSFVGSRVDTRVPAAYQLPWLKQVGLDVHTVSHDGVDIAVNASAFAIKARVETDLHIGGNALEPKLTGKVQAREGVIAFPKSDLRLSMAAVDFETSRRSAQNPVGAEVTLRAEGEVETPGGSEGRQTYEVFMNLDGPPNALALDLSSNRDLSRLDVLTLLSTGNAHVSDLARTGDEAAKLETAEALVGSLLTAPLSRFAQKKIEQVFNVNVDLAIKTGEGNVTVVAAKNINRRIRLEGAYSHGVGLTNTDQSNISTKAQMALTDRLRLEGIAAQSLTGASQSVSQSASMQSNLELKYRLLGP